MVHRIEPSRDIRQTLAYNEEKVTEKAAILLGAFNYLQETEELSFEDKIKRFRNLTRLNDRVEANTAHFSLNFHNKDVLSDEKLKQIASEFMEEIGFGRQPYLVYRHIDAGHPHAHIVTINIKPDGDRIPNDGLAVWKLIKICIQLEQTHGLVPARDKTRLAILNKEGNAKKLIYGQSPTKTGIAKVLEAHLDTYNFTSLDHWNALLGQYNVRADRGNEKGLMYKSKGLYYRMIDETGKKIGAPIKASAFDNKPILKRLEQKFRENQQKLELDPERKDLLHIRTAIDWTLIGKPDSLPAFMDSLAEKERIRVVIFLPRKIKGKIQDGVPEFFYINLQTRTITRDRDLGEKYTVAGLLERSGLEDTLLSLAKEGALAIKTQQDLVLLQDPRPEKKLGLLLDLALQHGQWLKTNREEQRSLSQSQEQKNSNTLYL
ncbi:relaxase/mobilization nuclease domain-containing protein [Flavitalea flava]